MAHRRQSLAPPSAGGASAQEQLKLAREGFAHVSSTMSAAEVDANVSEIPARIAELGQRVLNGGQVRATKRWSCLRWRIARIFTRCCRGAIAFVSILRGTRFTCVPSSTPKPVRARRIVRSVRNLPRTKPDHLGTVVDPEPVAEAGEEANRNGVTAVGLVAAWRGLKEGPMLDEVCDRIREMKEQGQTRPDASLGLIESQEVADRLKEAGLECYGHNLESSERFSPSIARHTRLKIACARLGF